MGNTKMDFIYHTNMNKCISSLATMTVSGSELFSISMAKIQTARQRSFSPWNVDFRKYHFTFNWTLKMGRWDWKIWKAYWKSLRTFGKIQFFLKVTSRRISHLPASFQVFQLIHKNTNPRKAVIIVVDLSTKLKFFALRLLTGKSYFEFREWIRELTTSGQPRRLLAKKALRFPSGI